MVSFCKNLARLVVVRSQSQSYFDTEVSHKTLQVLTEADISEEVDEANNQETIRKLRFCPHGCDKKEPAVEATCIICFKEYEPGEQVVWASQEACCCCHVFHLECMLRWISTGKDKCPICRNGFVPPFKEVKKFMEDGEASLRAQGQKGNEESAPQDQGENAVWDVLWCKSRGKMRLDNMNRATLPL